MKYCGVATPFRGIGVYTKSAVGMPGSETALEELMCHVLGDFLKEGCATNPPTTFVVVVTPRKSLSLTGLVYLTPLHGVTSVYLLLRPSYVPKQPPYWVGSGHKATYLQAPLHCCFRNLPPSRVCERYAFLHRRLQSP